MKSRIKYLRIQSLLPVCLMGALLFSASSCNDDNELEKPVFEMEKLTIGFIEHGGEDTLRLVSNQSWTAVSESDWCSVSPASGDGSAQLIVKADSSYLFDSRDAIIVIESNNQFYELVINQTGYKKEILLETDNLLCEHYLPAKESYKEVKVTSNVKYNVILPENADWLSVETVTNEPYPIPRISKVRFNFNYNTEPQERHAKVIFEAADNNEVEPVELLITQSAAPKIVPSRKGDSLAILSIARTLNAYNDWDPSRPIIHWNGVEMAERTYYHEETKTMVTEERVVGLAMMLFETDESLPFEVQFLTELEVADFLGNNNAFKRNIHLGPEITMLPKLRSLGIRGYGLISLPSEFANLVNLEELMLNGNNFQEIPVDVLSKLPKLAYLNMSANRRVEINDLSESKRDDLGLGGNLPAEVFEKLVNLEYLYLSYNFFEGQIPDLDPNTGCIPNLVMLSLNLNRFTGEIPDWILKHPNLACWSPDVLIFNQDNGRDSNGKMAGFTNIPSVLENPICPLWNDDSDDDDMDAAYIRGERKVSLKGNWRFDRF